MIYRIITEFRMIEGGVYDPEQKEYDWNWVLPKEHEYQQMTGAGDCFAEVMFLRGLRAPLIQNSRACFYFTERGWDQVGRPLRGSYRLHLGEEATRSLGVSPDCAEVVNNVFHRIPRLRIKVPW